MQNKLTYRHAFNMTGVALLAFILFPALACAQQLRREGGDMQAATNSSPWGQDHNTTAAEADAWFENYRFRDGETLPRLRIHYATLGIPRRNPQGQIDNAVVVIHWTGCNSLLSDLPRQRRAWKIK